MSRSRALAAAERGADVQYLYFKMTYKVGTQA